MRDAPGIRVFVVAEDQEVRGELEKGLSFEGGAVLVGAAANTWEALEGIREKQPDVVVVDLDMPRGEAVSFAEAVTTQFPGCQLAMVSAYGDAEHLRRAMLAGARELLTRPIRGEELVASIRRTHHLHRTRWAPLLRPEAPAPTEREGGEIIAVFSPKGGVGCTTVATNLAIALAQKTRGRVALVDLDLEFGDVAIMLNLHPERTIVELARHGEGLDDALLDGILMSHPAGVRVLAAPPRPELAELVSPATVQAVLGQLRTRHSFVVVDTADSPREAVLAALDLADRIILLATLELPAIKDAKLFLELATALGYPADKVLLVFNRADSSGGIRQAAVEAGLKKKAAASLVSDGRTATYALNQGIPLVLNRPESALARGILALAGFIVGEQALYPVLASPAKAPAWGRLWRSRRPRV